MGVIEMKGLKKIGYSVQEKFGGFHAKAAGALGRTTSICTGLKSLQTNRAKIILKRKTIIKIKMTAILYNVPCTTSTYIH
jgi:hypothetical protein